MRRFGLILAGLALFVVLAASIGIAMFRLFGEPACPSGEDSPSPVLVAKRLIPKGTSGSEIVKRRLHAAAVIPCRDLKSGAIADPAQLLGTVAVVDLFPGQQFTREDFSAS